MATVTDLYRNLFGKVAIKDGTVIDMAEHGRVGGLSSEQGYKFTRKPEEKTIIDEASSTVTYIGKTRMGGAVGDSVWQIKRISVSGTVTTIDYPNFDSNYNYEWDERASYSYS